MNSIIKKFKNFNIRTKLIVGFLSVLLPLVAILVVIFYMYSADIISHQTMEQTRETVDQFSKSLDNYMTLMTNKMEILADSPTVQEELNAPSDEVNVESDSFYSRNKQIRRIMLQQYSSVTMNDMELYGMNGTSYYFSVWSQKREIENEEELLRKADEAKGKWILINGEKISDTIQMIKQVKDLQTYKPIGYVRIGLKKEYVNKMTSNINFGSGGNIVILDESLKAISGNVKDSFILPMSQETLSRGNFLYKDGKNTYTVVYVHSNLTGWDTVGFVPMEYIQKNLAGIRNISVLLIFIAIIVGIMVSIVIARSLVSPIEDTAKALEDFAQGNFNVRLSENRMDEIGKMNVVFNKAIQDINELMQKVTQGEILKKEMEFKTLQSQMNPHFLYNTLDTINWMAFKEKQIEICSLVSAISNLMRVSISNKQSIVTLEQELSYVKDYLYIQHIRYRNRFDTSYDIDEELLSQTIPKLVIQPIVENAILHGIEGSQNKSTLYIGIMRNDKNIRVIVKDTGIGMSEEKVKKLLEEPQIAESEGNTAHTNLGMYAVHKRIQFMYGEEYGLEIQSKEGEGTTVILHIPYMEEPKRLYQKYNDLLGKK